VVERTVRGRKADIHYHVFYVLNINDPQGAEVPQLLDLSKDIAFLTVYVRWHSSTGDMTLSGTEDNNQAVYTSVFYRYGIGDQ
jgi:hypothetical protein